MNNQEKTPQIAEKHDVQLLTGDQDVSHTRGVAEIVASVMSAKRFPRNLGEARSGILDICKIESLALQAEYSYPRGGEVVSRPSIRLAEVMAQYWGNFDSGWRILNETPTYTEVEAYAWDMERNTRSTRKFTVKHRRKAKGKTKDLTDDRDIYELIANMASRRERACILKLIPKFIVDEAVEQCRRTIAENHKKRDPKKTAAQIIEAFEEYKITRRIIEEEFGCPLEKFNGADVAKIQRIWTALRDRVAKVEEVFPKHFAAKREAENHHVPPQSESGPTPENPPQDAQKGPQNAAVGKSQAQGQPTATKPSGSSKKPEPKEQESGEFQNFV